MAFAAIILVLLAGLLLGLLEGLLRGWVLSWLWTWFIVPLGVSELGVLHAWGIAIVVSMLTYQVDSKEDDRKTDWGKVSGLLLSPLIALLVGYIIHLYM